MYFFTYETSLASRAGPISDRVVNPVALRGKREVNYIFIPIIIIILVNCMVIYNYMLCVKKTYPRPTPATYPRGAGTPKKCFLFRVFNETEETAMLT